MTYVRHPLSFRRTVRPPHFSKRNWGHPGNEVTSPALFDAAEKRMLRYPFRSASCLERQSVFILRRNPIQLISLLLIPLCTFSLLSSVPIAGADLGDGSLNTGTVVTSPGQIEQPSSPATAPQKVHDLLKQLEDRGGRPLPGYIGGRDFRNRERRLPQGNYREYDVNLKIRGRGRDAERIVIEQRTGKAYYTGDHYRTFVPLN
jgi:ribonuclease T1